MSDDKVTSLEEKFGSLNKSPYRLSLFSELIANYKPVTWSVEGLLAQESVNVVFGGYGTYKSFLCLDLSLHVAFGIDWHGLSLKKGPSIYIAGEGHRGISTRLMGWQKHHHQTVQDEPDPHFMLTHASWPLTDPMAATEAADSVARYCDRIGEAPVHITIDTLARNFGDGDENSSGDVGIFYSNVETNFRDRFGATVVVVAHTGHTNQDRPRGSYNIIAAADSVYQMTWESPPDGLEQEGEGLILQCTKQKDAEMGGPFFFEHETVDLGINDNFGNPISTKIVRRSVSEIELPPGLGKNETMAFKVLAVLYKRARKNLSDGNFDPSQALVQRSDWRDECLRQGLIKQRFNQVESNLIENKNLIENRGLHTYILWNTCENNDLDD